MATIAEEINTLVGRLSLEKQQLLLQYARQLDTGNGLPPPKPINALRDFVTTVPPDIIDEMERIIEEQCERIEPFDDDLSF